MLLQPCVAKDSNDNNFRKLFIHLTCQQEHPPSTPLPLPLLPHEMVLLVLEQNIERRKRTVDAGDVLLHLDLFRVGQHLVAVDLRLHDAAAAADKSATDGLYVENQDRRSKYRGPGSRKDNQECRVRRS